MPVFPPPPPPDDGMLSLNRQLIEAAIAGDLPQIKKLMREGAEAIVDRDHLPDRYRRTTFLLPVTPENFGVMHIVRMHESNERLNAALYLAAFHGYDHVVDYLLRKSESSQKTLDIALLAASRSGSLPLVRRLVAQGANPRFRDDLCLKLAIGHDDTSDFLITQGCDVSAALVHAIRRRAVEGLPYLLSKNPPLKPAFDELCRRMASPPQGKTGTLFAAYELLMAHARHGGHDMQALIADTMSAATGALAFALVHRILAEPEFKSHPDRTSLAAAAMDKLAWVSRQTQSIAYDDTENLWEDLLQNGASAQAALLGGIATRNPEVISAAFRHGADPRRDHALALNLQIEADTYNYGGANIMLAAASRLVHRRVAELDAVDRARFQLSGLDGSGMTVQSLRNVHDDTGRTGLMIATAAHRFDCAAQAFIDAGKTLSAADLLAVDATGYRVLDVLIDRDDLPKLFNQRLWSGHPEELAQVWQALPPDLRASMSVDFDATISALQAGLLQDKLKDQAQTRKNHFRPR